MTDEQMVGAGRDISEMIDDYDWVATFGEGVLGYYGKEDEAKALMGEVKRVVCAVDGINDEGNWEGVFEMNDGRYLFVSAGCDYTGWG